MTRTSRFLLVLVILGSVWTLPLALNDPAGAAPASTPPEGAVAASPGHLICNSVVMTSTIEHIGGDAPGSVITSKCYGPKLPAGWTLSHFWQWQPSDGGGEGPGVINSDDPGVVCNEPSVGQARLGRYIFSCVVLEEWGDIPAPPVSEDPPWRNLSVYAEVHPAEGPPEGYSTLSSQATLWDHRSLFVAPPMVDVPWPKWWPSDVTPTQPLDADGELPQVACRVSQQLDLDGKPRANLRAEILNPDEHADDAPGAWQYEWEIEGGGLATSPAATAAEAWDTAPMHAGRVRLDVKVPNAGRPARGWVMRYTTFRTYSDRVGIGIPDPEWYEENGTKSLIQGRSVGITFPSFPSALEWLQVDETHDPDEALKLKATASDREELMAYALEDPASEDVYEVGRAWTSAQVRCSQKLELGDETPPPVVVTPTYPPGGSPVDPSNPSNPGGGSPGGGPESSDCGGLGWNPITWFETLSCSIGDVLGSMFRWLGDLIQSGFDTIGNLISDVVDAIESIAGLIADVAAGIVDVVSNLGEVLAWLAAFPAWLASAFVPEEPFSDRLGRISAAFGETDIGLGVQEIQAMGTGVAASFSDAQDAGDCHGPSWAVDVSGQHVEFAPLESCAGFMAEFRSKIRIVMGGFIVFLAGMTCFYLVAGPFGVEGGGDD